jgi:hypothetical protein
VDWLFFARSALTPKCPITTGINWGRRPKAKSLLSQALAANRVKG